MALKPIHLRRKSCLLLYILCVEFHAFGADDYRMCTKIYLYQNIFLKKGVPFCIIRILLDAYTRQQARVI